MMMPLLLAVHHALHAMAAPPAPTPQEAAAAARAATEASQAEAVIAAAVQASGLAAPERLEIRFAFRGTAYRVWLNGRDQVYVRELETEGGPVRVDRLEGDTLEATLAGERLTLAPDDAERLRRSLNSVAYFALLPRALQDDAVVARSLGRTELGGASWDTVEVTFRADGGGEDHDDVFRYWFHPRTHRIGFLAYTFARGKGGVRLRKATGYHEAGTLPALSTIVLEGVQVKRGAERP